MTWERWAYVGACVVVPVAWGLIVFALSNVIEARVHKRARERGDVEKPPMPPIDYHI